MLQEEIHHGRRSLRQNQRGQEPLLGSHGGVDIHILSHHLSWGMWADAWRSPTAFGTADAAKAAFILPHDQHRALIVGWPRGNCRLSLRFKFFLNCSWACGSACGCLGRGMSLRQP